MKFKTIQFDWLCNCGSNESELRLTTLFLTPVVNCSFRRKPSRVQNKNFAEGYRDIASQYQYRQLQDCTIGYLVTEILMTLVLQNMSVSVRSQGCPMLKTRQADVNSNCSSILSPEASMQTPKNSTIYDLNVYPKNGTIIYILDLHINVPCINIFGILIALEVLDLLMYDMVLCEVYTQSHA